MQPQQHQSSTILFDRSNFQGVQVCFLFVPANPNSVLLKVISDKRIRCVLHEKQHFLFQDIWQASIPRQQEPRTASLPGSGFCYLSTSRQALQVQAGPILSVFETTPVFFFSWTLNSILWSVQWSCEVYYPGLLSRIDIKTRKAVPSMAFPNV